MATIQAIAELVYRQIYPNPSEQNPTKLGEFIATAKILFAARTYYEGKEQQREEGEWSLPSGLLVSGELSIVSNRADLTGLEIMRSVKGDAWIVKLGAGDCDYTRVQASKLSIVSSDYLGNSKPYTVVGNVIVFIDGTHNDEKKVPIIYASNGVALSGEIDVDETVAVFVMDGLRKAYMPQQQQDKTNDNRG